MKYKHRMYLFLFLLCLLHLSLAFGQVSGAGTQSQKPFNPDILEKMEPIQVGLCRLSTGMNVYCEKYPAPNKKVYLALYLEEAGRYILVSVKEMNEDGSGQRNIWLHELAAI